MPQERDRDAPEVSDDQKKTMEREMVEKIPEETEMPHEWGDRPGVGKEIQSGGQTGKNVGTSSDPGQPREDPLKEADPHRGQRPTSP